MHKTIAKVTDDIGVVRPSTPQLRRLWADEQTGNTDRWRAGPRPDTGSAAGGSRLLTRSPRICFTLWQELKGESDIDNTVVGFSDEKAMVEDSTLVVVRVNGKVRANHRSGGRNGRTGSQERAGGEHLVTKNILMALLYVK
ncbi:hypothetical protein MJ572_03345 [Escherichia coli]|nr:hypothetical protein MJ572_03345 [Escherichia coli]